MKITSNMLFPLYARYGVKMGVGCALAYLDFRFPQINWRDDYPNLGKLFDKLSQRASFIDTAPPSA